MVFIASFKRDSYDYFIFIYQYYRGLDIKDKRDLQETEEPYLEGGFYMFRYPIRYPVHWVWL